jgi:hypothetical protein
MAVSTTNAFDGPFIANGVTTSFPFTFTAQTASDVRVLVDGADVSGYSVEIHADGGGTVSFDTAPATGSLLIWLDPDFAQTTAFEDGSAWLAGPVNAVNDRAALRDQALARDIGRGFMVPPGESGITLPTAAARSGKYFAFDAQGAAVLLPGTSPSPAQASMVAMSGGDSVDSAVEAQRFPTVAAMLASAIPARGTGRVWRASSFSYVEASASSADYHLITAGGVKLYAIPVGGVLSVEAFNAPNDGVADSYPAFLAAYNASPAGEGLWSPISLRGIICQPTPITDQNRSPGNLRPTLRFLVPEWAIPVLALARLDRSIPTLGCAFWAVKEPLDLARSIPLRAAQSLGTAWSSSRIR